MSYLLLGLGGPTITEFVLFGLLPGAAAPEDEGPSMSTVRVAQVRAYLRVTHRQDDAMLQDLINAAEAAAIAYMDRERLPRRGEYQVDECDSNTPPLVSDSDDLDPQVRLGIYKHVQAHYECEADDRQAGIESARLEWFPFRNQLGV